MTISSAIKYLRDGEAIKTPTMRGYISRTDNTLEGGQTANYNLNFVEGSNTDGDASETYSFNFITTANPDGEETTTVSAPGFGDRASEPGLKVDGDLLRMLLDEQWQSGSIKDFEVVRKGSGSRW